MSSSSPSPQSKNASLYVGELAPDVNEALLFEIFKPSGKIVSIRVCRDAMTRVSLGYAYVNFNEHSEAAKALDSLNFARIHDKPIRIMWSQRDPSLRNSGVGNIFIKNLDETIDNKALHDTFQAFGKILSCKVSYSGGKNGKPKSNGYGFVHYQTQEAADLAIAKMNGLLVNGKKVWVGPFKKKNDRSSSDPTGTFTNVYVKNIPKDWDNDKFKSSFATYGKIQNAALMLEEGQSRGFGFVNFEDHDGAKKAIAALNDKPTGEGDKKWTVCRAQSKQERQKELSKKFEEMRAENQKKRQGTNLYVRNFSEDIDEEELTKIFKPFGEIASVKIMRDPKKKTSRGFGFVCFEKAEEAQSAMTELNNKLIHGKPLFVALAQKKQVRRQQLEMQFRMRNRGMPMMRGQPMFYGQPMQQGYPMPYPQMVQAPQWQKPVQQRGRPKGQVQKMQMMQTPPLDAQMLSQLRPEQQKQEIGNRLFPLIRQIDPDNAPKITGMIIELPDTQELLGLIEDQQALMEKVSEAQRVLRSSQQ